MKPSHLFPGVRTQAVADTLIILYAVDGLRNRFTIQIYSRGADGLLLALHHKLGTDATLIMGTGSGCHLVLLHTIFTTLEPLRAKAALKPRLAVTQQVGYKESQREAIDETFRAISTLGIGGKLSEDVNVLAIFCHIIIELGLMILT